MPIRNAHRHSASAAAAAAIGSGIVNPHHPFEHHHPHSHPANPTMNTVKCSGCEMAIFDRYIMTVLERPWHAECLRCYTCGCPLQERCFARNDKLFCRQDFFRLFGIKCFGCGEGICPSELIQRGPRGNIYHLKCFICATCHKQLTTGDELYVINDGEFVCKEDFTNKHIHPTNHARPGSVTAKREIPSPGVVPPTIKLENPRSAGEHDTATAPEPAVPVETGRLNGRAARRTDTDDEDEEEELSNAVAAPADSASDKLDTKSACGDTTSSMDESEPRNDENNITAKRRGPRTTIKAKQLDLLKNAFASTPKPTRHIREQLAQETGLTMRVIQVWFQNRRSKERRMKQLTAMGSARRHIFRPRRSGVRSLRDFDGDSGDLIAGVAANTAPGFAFYPDGPGGHPGEFFHGHPGHGPGMGGHPGTLFEFHHFPPNGRPGNGDMGHFVDMSPNGHAMPGGLNDGPFGVPGDMVSQTSSPHSLTPDGYAHPSFDALHANNSGGQESPVWQTMAMAQ